MAIRGLLTFGIKRNLKKQREKEVAWYKKAIFGSDEKPKPKRRKKPSVKKSSSKEKKIYEDKNVKIKRIDISADRIKATVKELSDDKHYVKIGYPYESSDTQSDYPRSGQTVLDVALFHEYGRTDRYNIPIKRPFLEPSVEEGRDKYIDYQNDLIVDLAEGKITVKKLLEKMGLLILRDVKNYVRQKKVRPKSRRAIEDGGATLYDTGQLINSLTYVVKLSDKN